MKQTSKILSIILAILMVISAIPITVSAAEPTSGICGENVTWEFDKSTGTLTFSGTGPMNSIYNSYRNIPWRNYYNDIENVVISEGIYTIVSYAFYNCNNLVNVTLPKTLTSIGYHTFEECDGLTNITIPDSVIEIGDYAFSCCYNLTSVIIPNSVTKIGEDAFSYCDSLTSITLSNNITAIDFFTFSHCTNLKSVTIPEGVEIIRESAFHGCENLTNVTIPDSVTIIGVSAFKDCESITDVYYSGTEEQWKQISIKAYNWDLTGAAIHYNSTGADTHPYLPVVTLPTCTEQGYTTYICACGYSNNVVDNYVDATGHSHTSEITTPATHTATGVMTYTCACGDSYTEVIEKIAEHDYESVVTLPTCTKQGYTTYTCECGDSYIDDYVDALGHDMIIDEAIAPDCINTGLTEGSHCSRCDDATTEQEIVPELGHGHKAVITPPTCTEQGYTTYTCECGDSYVANYVDAIGHLFGDWVVTKEPTTDTEGEMERVCSCGEKEYKSIDKLTAVEDDDKPEQEETNKEDIRNPEIPDTNYETVISAYSAFMLIIFACVIASVTTVRKRRYK